MAFVGAPFELWDLRTLTLLRTMPKKFPPITALDWSPLHNLKHLKRKEREKLEKEQRNKEYESSGKIKLLFALKMTGFRFRKRGKPRSFYGTA